MKDDNRISDETVFQKFGASLYLRIPKHMYSFYNIKDLKKDDAPNTKPAKIQRENGGHGRYGSFWNPEQQCDSE